MTRDAVAIAQWKCTFLAKKIVMLRAASPDATVTGAIARYQAEMDYLIATIARACAKADAVVALRRAAAAERQGPCPADAVRDASPSG